MAREAAAKLASRPRVVSTATRVEALEIATNLGVRGGIERVELELRRAPKSDDTYSDRTKAMGDRGFACFDSPPKPGDAFLVGVPEAEAAIMLRLFLQPLRDRRYRWVRAAEDP